MCSSGFFNGQEIHSMQPSGCIVWHQTLVVWAEARSKSSCDLCSVYHNQYLYEQQRECKFTKVF